MKFGNFFIRDREYVNLGDYIQLIAIEQIYLKMGINMEDIIYIDTKDLHTYDGDYVVLPINQMFNGYGDGTNITCFSPKIIPVFLGFSVSTSKLNQNDIDYLKRFEPIGCRDEHTKVTMVKHGINAYVNGCLTITLPKKRIHDLTDGKIFLVDISEDMKKHLPEEILNNSVDVSHIGTFPMEANKSDIMLKYYQRYIDEAKLVITSRIHCASPCIAAGIPVIMMRENYSSRIRWLDKIIKIYTPDLFNNIDFKPKLPDLDDLKSLVLENAILQIKSKYEKFNLQYSISEFYEDSNKLKLVEFENFTSTKKFINQYFSDNKIESFSLWGSTQLATEIYHYIKEKYPSVKFKYIYDSYKQFEFFGNQSRAIECLETDDCGFLFVTGIAIYIDAEILMRKINKSDYFQCFGEEAETLNLNFDK